MRASDCPQTGRPRGAERLQLAFNGLQAEQDFGVWSAREDAPVQTSLLSSGLVRTPGQITKAPSAPRGCVQPGTSYDHRAGIPADPFSSPSRVCRAPPFYGSRSPAYGCKSPAYAAGYAKRHTTRAFCPSVAASNSTTPAAKTAVAPFGRHNSPPASPTRDHKPLQQTAGDCLGKLFPAKFNTPRGSANGTATSAVIAALAMDAALPDLDATAMALLETIMGATADQNSTTTTTATSPSAAGTALPPQPTSNTAHIVAASAQHLLRASLITPALKPSSPLPPPPATAAATGRCPGGGGPAAAPAPMQPTAMVQNAGVGVGEIPSRSQVLTHQLLMQHQQQYHVHQHQQQQRRLVQQPQQQQAMTGTAALGAAAALDNRIPGSTLLAGSAVGGLAAQLAAAATMRADAAAVAGAGSPVVLAGGGDVVGDVKSAAAAAIAQLNSQQQQHVGPLHHRRSWSLGLAQPPNQQQYLPQQQLQAATGFPVPHPHPKSQPGCLPGASGLSRTDLAGGCGGSTGVGTAQHPGGRELLGAVAGSLVGAAAAQSGISTATTTTGYELVYAHGGGGGGQPLQSSSRGIWPQGAGAGQEGSGGPGEGLVEAGGRRGTLLGAGGLVSVEDQLQGRNSRINSCTADSDTAPPAQLPTSPSAANVVQQATAAPPSSPGSRAMTKRGCRTSLAAGTVPTTTKLSSRTPREEGRRPTTYAELQAAAKQHPSCDSPPSPPRRQQSSLLAPPPTAQQLAASSTLGPPTRTGGAATATGAVSDLHHTAAQSSYTRTDKPDLSGDLATSTPYHRAPANSRQNPTVSGFSHQTLSEGRTVTTTGLVVSMHLTPQSTRRPEGVGPEGDAREATSRQGGSIAARRRLFCGIFSCFGCGSEQQLTSSPTDQQQQQGPVSVSASCPALQLHPTSAAVQGMAAMPVRGGRCLVSPGLSLVIPAGEPRPEDQTAVAAVAKALALSPASAAAAAAKTDSKLLTLLRAELATEVPLSAREGLKERSRPSGVEVGGAGQQQPVCVNCQQVQRQKQQQQLQQSLPSQPSQQQPAPPPVPEVPPHSLPATTTGPYAGQGPGGPAVLPPTTTTSASASSVPPPPSQQAWTQPRKLPPGAANGGANQSATTSSCEPHPAAAPAPSAPARAHTAPTAAPTTVMASPPRALRHEDVDSVLRGSVETSSNTHQHPAVSSSHVVAAHPQPSFSPTGPPIYSRPYLPGSASTRTAISTLRPPPTELQTTTTTATVTTTATAASRPPPSAPPAPGDGAGAGGPNVAQSDSLLVAATASTTCDAAAILSYCSNSSLTRARMLQTASEATTTGNKGLLQPRPTSNTPTTLQPPPPPPPPPSTAAASVTASPRDGSRGGTAAVTESSSTGSVLLNGQPHHRALQPSHLNESFRQQQQQPPRQQLQPQQPSHATMPSHLDTAPRVPSFPFPLPFGAYPSLRDDDESLFLGGGGGRPIVVAPPTSAAGAPPPPAPLPHARLSAATSGAAPRSGRKRGRPTHVVGCGLSQLDARKLATMPLEEMLEHIQAAIHAEDVANGRTSFHAPGGSGGGLSDGGGSGAILPMPPLLSTKSRPANMRRRKSTAGNRSSGPGGPGGISSRGSNRGSEAGGARSVGVTGAGVGGVCTNMMKAAAGMGGARRRRKVKSSSGAARKPPPAQHSFSAPGTGFSLGGHIAQGPPSPKKSDGAQPVWRHGGRVPAPIGLGLSSASCAPPFGPPPDNVFARQPPYKKPLLSGSTAGTAGSSSGGGSGGGGVETYHRLHAQPSTASLPSAATRGASQAAAAAQHHHYQQQQQLQHYHQQQVLQHQHQQPTAHIQAEAAAAVAASHRSLDPLLASLLADMEAAASCKPGPPSGVTRAPNHTSTTTAAPPTTGYPTSTDALLALAAATLAAAGPTTGGTPITSTLSISDLISRYTNANTTTGLNLHASLVTTEDDPSIRSATGAGGPAPASAYAYASRMLFPELAHLLGPAAVARAGACSATAPSDAAVGGAGRVPTVPVMDVQLAEGAHAAAVITTSPCRQAQLVNNLLGGNLDGGMHQTNKPRIVSVSLTDLMLRAARGEVERLQQSGGLEPVDEQWEGEAAEEQQLSVAALKAAALPAASAAAAVLSDVMSGWSVRDTPSATTSGSTVVPGKSLRTRAAKQAGGEHSAPSSVHVTAPVVEDGAGQEECGENELGMAAAGMEAASAAPSAHLSADPRLPPGHPSAESSRATGASYLELLQTFGPIMARPGAPPHQAISGRSKGGQSGAGAGGGGGSSSGGGGVNARQPATAGLRSTTSLPLQDTMTTTAGVMHPVMSEAVVSASCASHLESAQVPSPPDCSSVVGHLPSSAAMRGPQATRSWGSEEASTAGVPAPRVLEDSADSGSAGPVMGGSRGVVPPRSRVTSVGSAAQMSCISQESSAGAARVVPLNTAMERMCTAPSPSPIRLCLPDTPRLPPGSPGADWRCVPLEAYEHSLREFDVYLAAPTYE